MSSSSIQSNDCHHYEQEREGEGIGEERLAFEQLKCPKIIKNNSSGKRFSL